MPARPVPEKFLVAFSFAGEQRDLVGAIAKSVEKQLGLGNVFFDEWFEAYLAGDDADLKLQKIYKKSELAVVCVSQCYGEKPWTQVEHKVIRARQMELAGSKIEVDAYRIVPLRVGDGDVEGIPFNSIIPDVRNRTPTQSAELVIDRLRLIIPNLKKTSSRRPPVLSWPKKPSTLVWPMCNQNEARKAFAELLISNAGKRFLPIRGESETGKSLISCQMLANALSISGVACGRFDFKGTTDMDREVRAFIQELGVSPPPPNLPVHERLDNILGALRQKAQPTLLIFDTYEMAGEAQDWVEKQLLPCLIRATWLRVVIAGQKVPDCVGAVWAAVAHPTLQMKSPHYKHWYDYSKQHRPELKLPEVAAACKLSENKAGLLVQLLGPKR